VKKLIALLALTAAFSLTTTEQTSAQDYYYYEPGYTYSYDNSGYYYYTPHTNQGVWYQESRPSSVLGILQPIRDTAGDAAELYMDIHPGAQIAESVGLLDRGFVLGLFRGY